MIIIFLVVESIIKTITENISFGIINGLMVQLSTIRLVVVIVMETLRSQII